MLQELLALLFLLFPISFCALRYAWKLISVAAKTRQIIDKKTNIGRNLCRCWRWMAGGTVRRVDRWATITGGDKAVVATLPHPILF